RVISFVSVFSTRLVTIFQISFPTRRSSDLECRHLYRRAGDRLRGDRESDLPAAGYWNDPGPVHHRILVCAGLLSKRDLQSLRVQDRKSTRLNSSHVKISYAVSCLKKKILLI